MELMDLDRYRRISGVSGVEVKPSFTITDENIEKFAKKQMYFENFRGANTLKGKWISVDSFKDKFSASVNQRFGEGFKNKSILVVRDSKGVQNPETFAQDVIKEVVSNHARYVPLAKVKTNEKPIVKVECVREEDIQSVLRNYYVAAQKSVEAPVIEAARRSEPRRADTPSPSFRIDAHQVQNPARDTSGLPLSRMALPKLRAWYFSGKTMPLKDKAEEESFNRAIEVFHQKWSQDNKGMSFDEWLGKLLPEKITVKRPEKKAEAGSEVTTEETKPKKYYILKSGEYISETAFREAILKYFKEIEKDFTFKVVKKDKGVINVEELVDRIVESIPKNGKVNVAKKPTSPETPTLGETFPTRMQLPNGRFINLQDVAQALQNYMVVEKEKPKPVPPPHETPKKKQEGESFLDKFIIWLNGLLERNEETVEPDLLEKFKKAVEKLKIQWNEEKKKDPKKTHKTFREWVKEWIEKQEKNRGKKTSKGEQSEQGDDELTDGTQEGGDDPKKKRKKGQKGGDPRKPKGIEGGDDPREPKGKEGEGDTPRTTPKPTVTPGVTPTPGPTPTATPAPVQGENGEGTDSNPEKMRVTSRTTMGAEFKKWVAGVLVAVTLLPMVAGFGMQTVKTPYAYSSTTTSVQTVVDHQNVKYNINEVERTKGMEALSDEEILAQVGAAVEQKGNITLGDYQEVRNGTNYHLMASTSSSYKTIGEKGAHTEGLYRVTGLAISDGKNIAYFEDFNAENNEVDMKLIGAEAVKKGVDLQNAQVYVHVGSKKASTINFDGTQGKNRRAGWIPMGNWFAHVNTMAETENVTKTEHSGTIENFTGSEVSVNGSSFTVMDESGNPLKPGTYYTADGREYEIIDIALEDVTREETVSKTETKTGVETSKKLTYKLGIANFVGLGIAVGLLIAMEVTRRKINEKFKNNPHFSCFGDVVSFEQFCVDFEQTAKEMKQTVTKRDVEVAYKAYLSSTNGYIKSAMSITERAMLKIGLNTKSYCVVLTEKDESIIEQIAIETIQSSNKRGFNPETDTITIQGSKRNKEGVPVGPMTIVVNYNAKPAKDGTQGVPQSIDVTDQIMRKIKQIGQKNPVRVVDPATIKKSKIVQESEQSGAELGDEE